MKTLTHFKLVEHLAVNFCLLTLMTKSISELPQSFNSVHIHFFLMQIE